MNQQLPDLTRHNTSALFALSTMMHARGYWTAERDIEHDTASAIFELFQRLSWSDRSLHDTECQLMDAVLDVDKCHGGHIEKLLSAVPQCEGLTPRVPGCLAAAALHDSVHGTQFVNLVMNHLQNIALLILMADAVIKPPEMSAYREYFAELRRSFSAEPMFDK